MTRILRGCLALATLTMLSIAVLSLLPFLGRSTHAAAQTFGDGSVGAPFSAPCPGIGGIGSIGAIGGGGIGGLGGGIGAVGGGNLSGGGIGAIGGGGIGGIGTIAGIGSVSGVGGIGGVGAISGGCAFSGFGGGGGFGGFVVATPQSLVTAGDVMPLVVAWIVPAPGNWRQLESLQVRLRDADDVALWVRWEETTNTLALIDPVSLRPHSAGLEPGSLHTLTSAFARLDVRESAAEGSGPDGASVALLLAVTFESIAAGRDYLVEVGATSDGGDSEGFLPVGTTQVTAPKD